MRLAFKRNFNPIKRCIFLKEFVLYRHWKAVFTVAVVHGFFLFFFFKRLLVSIEKVRNCWLLLRLHFNRRRLLNITFRKLKKIFLHSIAYKNFKNYKYLNINRDINRTRACIVIRAGSTITILRRKLPHGISAKTSILP